MQSEAQSNPGAVTLPVPEPPKNTETDVLAGKWNSQYEATPVTKNTAAAKMNARRFIFQSALFESRTRADQCNRQRTGHRFDFDVMNLPPKATLISFSRADFGRQVGCTNHFGDLYAHQQFRMIAYRKHDMPHRISALGH
jgi:hypothetical protein